MVVAPRGDGARVARRLGAEAGAATARAFAHPRRALAGTSLTLQAFVQRDPETGDYNGLPAQGTLLPHPLGRIPLDLFTGEPSFERFSRDQRSIGWLFTHDFNESLTLQHKLRYLSADSQYRNVSRRLAQPRQLHPDAPGQRRRRNPARPGDRHPAAGASAPMPCATR